MLAERAYAEGERLRAEQREESYRKAIEKYEEARARWQPLGQPAEEAATLKVIGEVYLLLGEPKKTVEYYRQGLSLVEATGDTRARGELLSELGYALAQVGDNQPALDYCSQALPLARESHEPRLQAMALINLGEVYYSLGDRPQALAYYQQALPYWQLNRAVNGFASLPSLAPEDRFDYATALGIDLGQGFFFSRPVAPSAIAQLMDQRALEPEPEDLPVTGMQVA